MWIRSCRKNVYISTALTTPTREGGPTSYSIASVVFYSCHHNVILHKTENRRSRTQSHSTPFSPTHNTLQSKHTNQPYEPSQSYTQQPRRHFQPSSSTATSDRTRRTSSSRSSTPQRARRSSHNHRASGHHNTCSHRR
jgi:hypothetical protein